MLGLYSDKAILMPTFSNRVLRTPAELADYFYRLCQNEGLRVELHERTLRHQDLVSGICVVSGIYCWRMLIDSEPLSFEARFSYTLDTLSDCPILHHHSSQIPRTL